MTQTGRRALTADGNDQYAQYRSYGNDAIDASKDQPTQYRSYGNDAIDASKDQPTQYRSYGNDAIDASGDIEPPPLPNYDELYYPDETEEEREMTQTPSKLVRVDTDGSIVDDKDVVKGRGYCFANSETMQTVYCT
ncbi:hypothetical protein H632_c1397p0 [Helicosporidium sp. ATCC 50920]|nr:hypothetical protein H632_c1397p0 [Helicosporidium sp. ATCC 50920]|eukprot:KDD74329.1 hypothetical protein H632_c1397p0 [Helicosporidium sp. ATCC 50920]